MGDTIANTLTFYDLRKGEKEFLDFPTDRNTIAKVRDELAHVPLEVLHKLSEEIPEIETFLIEKRPDFKEKTESSKQPQYQPGSPTHITVVPKRKIKRHITERKMVDGKVQETDWIELDQ